MSIAVIIATIPERAELLTRAVASVTAQTLQPDEIAIAVARPDEPAWSTRQRALDIGSPTTTPARNAPPSPPTPAPAPWPPSPPCHPASVRW